MAGFCNGLALVNLPFDFVGDAARCLFIYNSFYLYVIFEQDVRFIFHSLGPSRAARPGSDRHSGNGQA